jgi:VCBS repeat-containing protein
MALALLGALAALGTAAVVYAAGGKADFSVTASPSSQTLTAGQSVAYTATVTRVNGFTEPVSMSVTGLPAGATATWKLSDGTSSNTVPSNLNSATLTIQTSTTTPSGTVSLTIAGASSKLSHSTTVTLVVQPATQPNFTLGASPASQTIGQGDSTSYAISVNRANFTGPVSLSLTGLPQKATATWSPSSTIPGSGSSTTLQIATDANISAGTYPLTITGTGTINGSPVSRSATVTLVVQKNQSFLIAGDLGTPLAPGSKVPLDLKLTNPSNFDLLITNLAVEVAEGTSKPSCSGTQNFKITQFTGAYPVVLHPGTSQLSALVPSSSRWPQVEMLNLAANQDVCRNATITLRYSGSATK